MKQAFIVIVFAALILGGASLLESCRKRDATPFRAATPVSFTIPQGFPQPTYPFHANPLSEEGFVLGRKLFYEGRLSIDGNFPCASCHQPVAAFTTYEHDRSHGYNHSHTLRNAPGLFNLAWYPAYRQDGSGKSLSAVSMAHLYARDEMASDIETIVGKLKGDTMYQRLFRSAFGSPEVNGDRILKALDQFMVLMVSANAKYDRVKKGTATFTTEEAAGYQVFQAKCGSCHKEPLFTDFTYRNTGLVTDPLLHDAGRYRVTGKGEDSLKFRVPSLRNLSFTAYYGHDGRMNMFRHMIQHYRSGVVPSANVDPLVKNGIPLTITEENNLVFFLRTLDDSSFLANPRFRE